MCQRNEHDFTSLIGRLLTEGWTWLHDPPSEAELNHWLRVGRAHHVLQRKRRTTNGLIRHYVSLLRAKHESAPANFDRRVGYVGEWSAWEVVDNPYENPWSLRDIERWI